MSTAMESGTNLMHRIVGTPKVATATLRIMRYAWLVVAAVTCLRAADVIPPAPPDHFNDFAHVVPAATAAQLDRELTQFERDTSNQIVVAIYPNMQSDSSLEDYATRVYQAWHIGQKGRDNGALLLVFTQSHRMRIQTGYGLEGALPDALCARIMSDEIAPRLRAGDYAGGLSAGVHAMMAATRGEYKGSGRTTRDAIVTSHTGSLTPLVVGAVIILFMIMTGSRRRRAVVYGRRGRNVWVGPTWWGGGGWGGGGGGWSGGGGFGGGGGGSFSGGGGSTGGGGASGSW